MLHKYLLIYTMLTVLCSTAFTQNTNTCLHLDGKSNHIAIATHPKIELDSGTIEIWIKYYDTLNKEWQSIVAKNLSYQITLYYDSLAAYDWKNKNVISFYPKVNNNQWHHLALVFKRDVPNGSQLFLDGKPLGNPFTYQFLFKGNELQIGANNYEPQFFKGYIDDFRLWNIPRTPQQIHDNYLHELTGTEEGLVIYYKFNDGKPNDNNFNITLVEDETNNNLHGKLVGFLLKDSLSNFTNASPVKIVKTKAIVKYYRKNKLEVFVTASIILTLILLIYTRIFYLKKRNRVLNKMVLQRTKALNETIAQKDYLLQEVHHRVKNNLQIISTMLQLEIDNDRTIEQQKPLLETARRLQCMSLVHEQLYRIENLEKIDAKKYIETLVASINEMVNADNRKIKFRLNIISKDLLITKCLPVGFIISEMVSNSIQHAFTNTNTNAEVDIEFTESENSYLQLAIKDNGIGVGIENLKEIQNHQFTTSLGLRLVEVFTNQLEGSISFMVNNGFGIKVKFKA